MGNDFYSTVKIIDKFKSMVTPNDKDVYTLISIISQAECYEQYFFHDFDKVGWFDYFRERRIFQDIKKVRLADGKKRVSYPVWWPGKYLVNVAGRIPSKVFEVIMKIDTNNYSVRAECAQAILKMPSEFLKKNVADIVGLFDKWLDLEYADYIVNLACDLFIKYFNLELYDETCRVLDILSKTKKRKHGGVQFRIAMYYISNIVEKYLPKLIEQHPMEVLQIVENRFRISLSSNDNKSQYNDLARPTVEDSSETWRHDARDLLFEAVRDALQTATISNPVETKMIVVKYLSEKDTIFERLAIHIVRLCDLDNLAITILTDKNNLHRPDIYHEFALLLRKKFSLMETNKKKQLVAWILEGPIKDNEEGFEQYRKFWQARWLMLIKEYIEKDEDLSELRSQIEFYRDEFSKIEHPDLLSYTKTFVGPKSPLDREQLEKRTPKEFITWARKSFPPPYDPFIGTPEGVARTLEEVIRQQPEVYAQSSELFLDENLWPTYLSGFVRGLENAIKDRKTFDLIPVLGFFENSLKFHSEPDERYDYYQIGTYSWLRRTIASFIATLVREDKFPLSPDLLERTQRILVEIIEKDEDPTEESEKKYGSESGNMGYVMSCMNSNRGQAMVALIHHALRRARMCPEIQTEERKSKSPFPPGERMELYKEFLTARLDQEKSPAVQSSYGQFLVHLYFLDQEWVKRMRKNGYLFPKAEERAEFWNGHWEGYIGYNYFYNELFVLLNEEYRKSIGRLVNKNGQEKEYDHYDERLTEHLVFAYWRRLIEITNGDSILNLFFMYAPCELRGRFISRLANALGEEVPTKDSENWERLKKLWKFRVETVKDDELAYFTKWLEYCPDQFDDIVDLIKPIIPFIQYGMYAEDLLNYMRNNVDSSVINVLSLLNNYLKMKEESKSILFKKEIIMEILTKARKSGDSPEMAKEINEAVNLLGQMGHYDFRGLLIQ